MSMDSGTEWRRTVRTWFTAQNTDGLPSNHLTILNRAARHLRDGQTEELTRLQLMGLHTLFKPGMSASDLLEKYERETS